jgi:hypothetical protein
VLKIFGAPYFASASCKAAMQKETSTRQNCTAGPVDDRHQIEKSRARYVRRPELVHPLDRKSPQQIGENLVAGRGFAGVRLRNERRDSHPPHQSLHALAVDRKALGMKHRPQTARRQKRPRREQFVDPTHQQGVIVIGWFG